MEISKCLDCGTNKKDYRSKRCKLCSLKENGRNRKGKSIVHSGSFKKGHRVPKRWRQKVSEARKGKIPWIKGKKHTEESKKKMSQSLIGLNKGEKNYLWKGEKVSYRSLHAWVNRWLGKPTKCDFCGRDGLIGRMIHWANKSREYKRDLRDWLRLCRGCHTKYDKNIIKL